MAVWQRDAQRSTRGASGKCLRSPRWGGATRSKVEVVHIAAALEGEVGAVFTGDGGGLAPPSPRAWATRQATIRVSRFWRLSAAGCDHGCIDPGARGALGAPVGS